MSVIRKGKLSPSFPSGINVHRVSESFHPVSTLCSMSCTQSLDTCTLFPAASLERQTFFFSTDSSSVKHTGSIIQLSAREETCYEQIKLKFKTFKKMNTKSLFVAVPLSRMTQMKKIIFKVPLQRLVKQIEVTYRIVREHSLNGETTGDSSVDIDRETATVIFCFYHD